MLLNSETAVKAAHDIVHDAEEIFTKWPLLVAGTSETVPEGYVDIEFSDGVLIRMPCSWHTRIFEGGAVRYELTFKRNGTSAKWKAGVLGEGPGAIYGLLADAPVSVEHLVAGAINAIPHEGTAPINIESATFDAIEVTAITVSQSDIRKMDIEGTLYVHDPVFENIGPDTGHLDADLSYMAADEMHADNVLCTGEKIVPLEKMATWVLAQYTEAVDASYFGYIPMLPLDAAGMPVNGFGNPLSANPFYPDWLYSSSQPAPYRPYQAWVPSRERPRGPCWLDSDGIYWYQVNVTSPLAIYDNPCVVFPPRCQPQNTGLSIVPPVKADADGMVVTVKHISNTPGKFLLFEKYQYVDDNTWEWVPGETLDVNGPSISQFIVKRKFVSDASRIISVEYQFLPTGEI